MALIVCVPLFTNFQMLLRVRETTFIRFWEVALYWFLFSLVFEVFSPLVLKRGFADVWDVVAYAIGGVLLYVSQYLQKGRSEPPCEHMCNTPQRSR